MSYLVLARKYRPQTFNDVIGQEHITQTLANAISANRLSHALLLSGPRGTGKTTMARLLAKAMNCEQGPTATPCGICENCKAIAAGYSSDVLEIDGASNNGVDQVRELRENSKYMPSQSRYKIYIIDEVHMLSLAAFNALLKTLEEPPAHVLFFFATTERHKLPITILSRCQRYDFRRVQPVDIAKHLGWLCQAEKIEIDPACLDTIAREAEGSVRDSISLLDQVISTAKGAVDMEHTLLALGITERRNVLDLAEAILKHDAARTLDLVAEIYDSGYDLRKLYQDLLEHLRDLLLVKMGQDQKLISGDAKLLWEQAQLADVAAINYYMDTLFRAEGTIKYASNGRLALETVLLRLLAMPTAVSIDTIIDKLDDLCKGGLLATPKVEVPAEAPVKRHFEPVMAPVVENIVPEPEKPPTALVDSAAEPIAVHFGKDYLPAVLSYLTEHKAKLVAEALKGASIKSLDDHKVVIAAIGTHIALNRLKSDKYTEAICKAFKAVVGRDLAVEIEGGAVETNNAKNAQELHQKEKQLTTHPIINDAVEIFNGDVLGVKKL